MEVTLGKRGDYTASKVIHSLQQKTFKYSISYVKLIFRMFLFLMEQPKKSPVDTLSNLYVEFEEFVSARGDQFLSGGITQGDGWKAGSLVVV